MFELKDPKFFKSLIQSLQTNKTITFKITSTSFILYTTENPFFFLNIESTFFTSEAELIFTLNPSILYRYISLITTSTVFLVKNELTIKNKIGDSIAEVYIPLLTTIDFDYKELQDITNKFFIKNYRALSSITGIVNYRIEDGNLKIRRDSEEMKDEVVIYDVEVISKTNLNFTCCNKWTNVFENLDGYIEKVRFMFGNSMLFVQFLLKNYENSFVEIAVPKTLVD